MEPEFEKPRNVPERPLELPPHKGSYVADGILIVSVVMIVGSVFWFLLFELLKNTNRPVSGIGLGLPAYLLGLGIGLLGIARIVSYLDRLVELREWELTRQLRKEE